MNNLLRKVENAVSYHTKSKISKYDILLGDETLLQLIIDNIDNKYEYDTLRENVLAIIDRQLSGLQLDDYQYIQTEPVSTKSADDQINNEIFHSLNQIENKFVRSELIRVALAPKKMFRAKMYLKMDANENYQYAALIELFHLATLIQDDVIDMATTRRYIQTINQAFDDRTAILIADYLIVHIGAMLGTYAQDKQKQVKATNKKVQKYYKQLITDFIKSLLYSEREVSSIADLNSYETYACNKTAKFFKVALISGLMANDGDYTVKTLDEIGQFGLEFGLLFQKVDDLLDYIGDVQVSGKDSRDIENNVNNFVLLSLKHQDLHQIKSELIDEGNQLLGSKFGSTFATEINYLINCINDK